MKFLAGVADIYRQTGHIHMIIGSNKNKLEDIVRDMKSFTSTTLKKSIKENVQESRKECLPDFGISGRDDLDSLSL